MERGGGFLWTAQVSLSYYVFKCGFFYGVRMVGLGAPFVNLTGPHPELQGWHRSGPL